MTIVIITFINKYIGDKLKIEINKAKLNLLLFGVHL